MRYDPGTFTALTFHDAVPQFATGTDTPRAYLERCLAQMGALEPVVKAFVGINEAPARAAADASSARWKAGQPLSAIDGMPLVMNAAGATARSLRKAGAVIMGKTGTAQLASVCTGPTTHPFDAMRTGGGGSAGLAAAVAARLCSAALGTPARGCAISSASHCGTFALEPTPQAFNPSVHAGSIEDLWQLASAIGLCANSSLGFTPEATRPCGLIVIESAFWKTTDAATRTAFEALMDQIACAGVALLRRRDHPAIEAFEQAIAMQADDQDAQRLQRALAPRAHAALSPLSDAIVMLSAPGPAPMRATDLPAHRLGPRDTEGPVCKLPNSVLNAPALTLPLMAVDGMPVGVQLMGQSGEDTRVVALARWVAREAGTVVV